MCDLIRRLVCISFINDAVGPRKAKEVDTELSPGLSTGGAGVYDRSDIGDFEPRQCDYNEVKAWVKTNKYYDPEWPLFIESECGP